MVGRIREILFDEGVDVDGIAIEAASKDYVDGKFDPKLETFEDGIWLDNTSGLPTLSPWRAGVIAWDTDNKCMAVSSAYDGTWVQVGEETQDDGVNKTGGTLSNGTIVYIDGAQGNRPKIYKANANDPEKAQKTIGLVTADSGILDNQEGPYTTSGVVRNLNTSAYADGTVLWLSTTDGLYTNTLPSNQYRHIMIGIVVKSHITQGEIYVNIRDLTDEFALAGFHIVDPHGWTEYDNTYMTRSWVGTTFTLTQVGSSTPYFCKGALKQLVGNKSITVNPTAGPHWLALNCDTEELEDFTSFPVAQALSTHIITEFYYASGVVILYNANERHTTKFPKRVWLYNHYYLSTQYRSGITPSMTSINGNGSNIDHARFSTTAGIVSDDDIDIDIAALTSSAAKTIWYYRPDLTLWVSYSETNGTGVVPFGGTGMASYNSYSTGAGLIECTNNYHVLTHLFAANNGTLIAIMGNNQYQLLADARLAASTEIATLLTQGLPFPEFRAIATFINKTSNTYSNAVKSAILSVDTGVSYIDWRKTALNPVAGQNATSHNNLTSLQGGQSGEYYHLTNADYLNIINKIFPGGAASDTGSKLIFPTKSGLAGITPTAGNAVYDTAAKKLYIGDGSAMVPSGSGSGSGEKNYIINPSASDNVTGWVASSANLTVARTTTAAQCPRENTTGTAISLTSSTDEAYAYYRFTLDDVDLSKKLKAVLAFINADTSDAWRIEVWKNSASNYSGTYTELTLSTDSSGDSYLPVTTGEYKTTFDTDSTAYLELRIVHNGTNSDVLYISDVIVGPGNVVTGAVVESSKSYMFTHNIANVTTAQFTGARVGDWLHLDVGIAVNGNGGTSADITINMPAGLTINLSAIGLPSRDRGMLGWEDQSAPATKVVYFVFTSSTVIKLLEGSSIASYLNRNALDNGDSLTGQIRIPIAEWAGSGTVNLAGNDVEYAYNSDRTNTVSVTLTGYAYGPAGVAFSNQWGTGTTWTRRVKFQSPIQTGDKTIVEVNNGTGWVNAEAAGFAYTQLNTSEYGIQCTDMGADYVDVKFCSKGANCYNAATYAAVGIAFTGYTGWKWRVRKVSASSVAGFEMASATSAGLVKTTFFKNYFTKDSSSASAWTKTGVFSVSTSTEITAEVGGKVFTIPASTAVTIVDSATTGRDYYIYLRTDGTLGAYLDSSSAPSGGRLVGGFHYAPGGNTSGEGKTTPQINQFSFWDLKWKPACSDPRGMTLVAGKFWADIYLLNQSAYAATGVPSSKYNLNIADGASDSSSTPLIPADFGGNGTSRYVKANWWNMGECLGSFQKRYPTNQEFMMLAYGTTEESSIGSDPVTTGLSGGTYTSKWGVIQSTGCLWVWGQEWNSSGATFTAAWTDLDTSLARGQVYQDTNAQVRAVVFGGAWVGTSYSGSRCSSWDNSPSVSGGVVSARGVCDHVILV